MALLDERQILQKVLNDAEDALKVDVEITAGTISVSIDQTTDSIKIGDGVNLLKVTPGGSAQVSVTDRGQQPSSNSIPVVLANDQSTVSVTLGLDPRQIRQLIPSDSVSIANFPVVQQVSLTSATVSVNNFPNTQTVNGSVSVSSLPSITGSVSVINFPAVQITSGTHSVNNFPTIQTVSGSVSITSLPSVTVSNFPATQVVSGTTSINNFPNNQLISGSVSVVNLPAIQVVSGTTSVNNFPVIQITSGTHSVNNFPLNQIVSGSLAVINFPTTQQISGSIVASGTVSINSLPAISGSVSVVNFPATQVITGTTSINNFPTNQVVSGTTSINSLPAITGSVNVTNFPGNQLISGSIAVNNFPATQPISAIALPLPTGASTETTLGTRLADATFTTRINTLGQKTSAASTPVVIASDQSILVISGTTSVNNFPTTQAISAAALPLPTGAATSALQTNGTQKTQIVDASGNIQPSGDVSARSIFTTTSITKASLTGQAPTAVSVGVASGVVLVVNASRKGLVLTNLSSNKVCLNVAGTAAVLNSGITLYPGGTWVMDDYTFTTAAINGIASAASSVVAVQEFD